MKGGSDPGPGASTRAARSGELIDDPASDPVSDPVSDVALALTTLPSMGLAHLIQVCREWPVTELVRALREGSPIPPIGEDKAAILPAVTVERIERWRRELDTVDILALKRRYARADVTVLVRGASNYPERLRDDEFTSPVLFARGDLALLERPGVAIVGTRSASRVGLAVARRFGEELAYRGYAIVSGLALGIDGAAHEGALEKRSERAPGPIGVVASGLDVCYPRRHEKLWAQVTGRGLMLSTSPLGMAPGAHLFPKRNRVIAGLGRITLVVESHRRGGSLHTARAARELGRRVLACPGALDNPAGEGTNALLADGEATLCRDINDVLLALGQTPEPKSAADPRPEPSIDDALVLVALGWDPCTLDSACTRSRQPMSRVVLSLARLESVGWVQRIDGRWQRIARLL